MNIKEFADHLGLSTATVSKALNDRSDIGQATKKRVTEAARRLGYSPSVPARNLRNGRTMTVALLLPSDNDYHTASFFMRINRGIQEELHLQGYSVIILVPADREDEQRLLEKIVTQGLADGVIIADTEVHDGRIEYLDQQGFPFVAMGRSLSLNGRFNSVDLNHEEMAAASVRQAVKHGYRRPALVTLEEDMMHGQCFAAGWQRAIADYRQSLEADARQIIYAQKNETGGYTAMKQLMAQPQPPDFVILINDLQLAGALQYRKQHGYQNVGLSCAITSSEIFTFMNPAPWFFRLDYEQTGRQLALALMNAVNKGDPVSHIVDVPLMCGQARAECKYAYRT